MAYAPAASDTERLPWLADEGKPPAKGLPRSLLAWATAAALLIAGGSYWYGMSGPVPADELVATRSAPVPAVEARPPASPVPDVRPSPMPRVDPVPAPPLRVSEARPVRSSEEARPARKARATRARSVSRSRASASRAARARASRPARVAARPAPAPSRYWPSYYSAGAAGRMVRIGTFGSRYQAKRGWVRLTRSYPGIQRLPAVVVANRSLRNGRTYYRLQIGTTSQAHSAVLCQRMRIIAQSCVVVGSPSRGA